MSTAVNSFRVVIVLYRTRLRTIRPVLQRLRRTEIPNIIVSVFINIDNLKRLAAQNRRSFRFAGCLQVEVLTKENATGVAGAYNHVINAANENDLLLLLDADGVPDDSFFRALSNFWQSNDLPLVFFVPELFSVEMRVSPYRLNGIVPLPIKGDHPSRRLIGFGEGIGVINSCLAGTISSFRQVNGFNDRIPIDLSDVSWSVAAAQVGAMLWVETSQAHDLSMRSSGFSTVRLLMYLRAVWRLGMSTGDLFGAMRLCVRGFRAHRMLRRYQS